jgi:iron complex outermembrane receptor protein
MNNNRRINAVDRASLAAAVSMAVLLPELALAQDVASPTQGASLSIEEVMVTARKKSESLQDVPMSVSTFSSDVLDNRGFVDLSSIGRMTPGLHFEAFDPTRPLIYVRGIGTRAYDAGSDPSVGLFVDGAFHGRFGSLNMNLLDVERIEVLKGPQGTLYGRNTIGGAISVITKDPAESLEFDLSGEMGASSESGDNIYSTAASLSTPLVEDTLSMRMAVAAYDRDGYVKVEPSGVRGGGLETLDGRVKFLWTPSESFEGRLSIDYSDLDWPPIVFNSNDLNGTAPTPGPLAPGVEPVPSTGKPFKATGNISNVDVDRKAVGGTLTLDWGLDSVDLTSITNGQSINLDEYNELDGTSLDYSDNVVGEDTGTFAQELRLTGASDRLSWLLGAYYSHEKIDRVDDITFGQDALLTFLAGVPLGLGFGVDVESTSYAGFGQLDWMLTDRLSLTLGLRYSDDDKTADYDTTTNVPGFVLTPYKTSVGDSWTSTDGTVTLSYDFNDDTLGYVTYSTGYKPGGFQFAAITPEIAQTTFEPETVESNEVGVKTTVFDQRLKLNAAAFTMDYKDLQLLRVVPSAVAGVDLVVISNAARSTISGMEVEGSWLIAPDLLLDFGASYLDAEFDSYQFSPELDFSGNTMPRAPEFTYTLALRYEQTLGAGVFDSTLAYSWQDRAYFEADNNQVDPDSTQKAHGLLDVSVSYTQNAWTFSLWGTNLLDEEYRRSVFNTTGNSQRQVFAAPATAGAKITYSFR